MDSLVGKVITGRSIPGQEVRRMDKPLIAGQQQQYYRTTQPPPRGTGLGIQQAGPDLGTFVAGVVIGFIIGGFLLTATGRKIVYKTGERVAAKI